MVALARAFLDDPRWVWHAAERLGAAISYPPQYARVAPAVWPGAAQRATPARCLLRPPQGAGAAWNAGASCSGTTPGRIKVGPEVSFGMHGLAAAVRDCASAGARGRGKAAVEIAAACAAGGMRRRRRRVVERGAHLRQTLAIKPAFAHALANGPAVGLQLVAADMVVPALVVEDK